MKKIEGINFKFRCSEDINKMPNCSSGKYCSTCNKTVIDFRKSDSSELVKTLLGKPEVCGIFSVEQTNLGYKLPVKNMSFYRRYAIGILVSLGITFFSKESFAQNSTQDSSKSDSKTNEYQNAYFGGVSEYLPQYKKGGNEALVKFIKNNINYPTDAKAGKVFVAFVIDTLGKVTEPRIMRGLNQVADKEALRVVKLLEFTPGIQNGKLKSYSYTVPILFNTEK